MKRLAIAGALTSLLLACTTNGDDQLTNHSAKDINTAVEASAVPEVAEIPTKEAALEQAEASINAANADAVYEDLLSEIEAELNEQP